MLPNVKARPTVVVRFQMFLERSCNDASCFI